MTAPAKPYRFTNKWFSTAGACWPILFKQIGWDASKPCVIVEIGSFEGASACWMLDNLMKNSASTLYCIDTFAGSAEHSAEQKKDLYERFRSNVALTGKSAQVKAMIGRSEEALLKLAAERLGADFVYVDGSHAAADVLSDAVLAWKILKPGGLLIFDDYLWSKHQDRPLLNPKIAIDAFVNCHLDQVHYIYVPQVSQFCLLKARPRPQP
jgi:predicted O-methyltransferase YrrM